jgi:hypothetical protein
MCICAALLRHAQILNPQARTNPQQEHKAVVLIDFDRIFPQVRVCAYVRVCGILRVLLLVHRRFGLKRMPRSMTQKNGVQIGIGIEFEQPVVPGPIMVSRVPLSVSLF